MDRATRAAVDSVRRMYELDGMTTRVIAQRVGVSQSVVREYLRESYREQDEANRGTTSTTEPTGRVEDRARHDY